MTLRISCSTPAFQRQWLEEGQEVVFEDFKVVRQRERGRTEAANPVTLNRYTFSLVNAANQPQPTACLRRGYKQSISQT